MASACSGASCLVFALSGLRDVIADAQTSLLEAALGAGIPRFIPSDYCIDFTRLPPGTNRNLDWRREFRERVDDAALAATSILSGAFTEMLTGQAPIILFKGKRGVTWATLISAWISPRWTTPQHSRRLRRSIRRRRDSCASPEIKSAPANWSPLPLM